MASLHSPSPPTTRVVAVIELLASQPDRELKLSELTQQLGMSKATGHAVVRTLLDAGYLVRSPRTKGYLLGPALIAAGRAAELSFPALQVAAPVVRDLARRFDAECVASIIDNGFITVVDWSGGGGGPAVGVGGGGSGATAGAGRPWSHVGQRVPAVPPFGAVQVAWMDRPAVEEWLSRALPVNDVDDLRAALKAVRSRGYDVQSDNDSLARFREVLADFDTDSLSDDVRRAIDLLTSTLGRVEYLPRRLQAARRYAVNALAAPVFGPAGRPVLTLSLHVSRRMTGREVEHVGRCLRQAADEITVATGGREPPA